MEGSRERQNGTKSRDGAEFVPGDIAGSVLAGVDIAFFHRVYRTSAVLAVLAALFLWEGLGLPAVLGWLIGVALNLGALASVEWGVRRVVRPGARSLRMLLLVSLLKFVVIAAIILGVFAGAQRGIIAPLWALAGFMLPHLVIVLKLLGQKLVALQDSAPPPGR